VSGTRVQYHILRALPPRRAAPAVGFIRGFGHPDQQKLSNYNAGKRSGDPLLAAPQPIDATKAKGPGSFFEALAQAWGKALDEQAARVQQ
jgi:hypothetical protein